MMIDYEKGKPEKVVQIMPLPNIKKIRFGNEKRAAIDFISPEGREYYTVGAVLTDQGNVYPLLYDGALNFIAMCRE